MTDRELLELAARAAGITLVIDPHGKYRNATGAHDAANVFSLPLWNSLRDPGDALRLAVALDIQWETYCRYADDAPVVDCNGAVELQLSDPLAATMRAITRAAAEIERAKT